MKYAVGVTAIAMGAILIYSGFRNVPIWDNVLAVARGEAMITAPSNVGNVLGNAVGAAGSAAGAAAGAAANNGKPSGTAKPPNAI